ncbi:MAG: hypothetical protein WCA79_04340, partial [Anaerolineales bacterium]
CSFDISSSGFIVSPFNILKQTAFISIDRYLTYQNGTNAVRYAAVVPPKLGCINKKSRCDATGEKASLTLLVS